MNRNEKRLATLLGVIVIGWIGLVGIESWFLQPLRTRRSKLESLTAQRELSLRQRQSSREATQLVLLGKERSVSGDEAVAVTRLQSWLLDLGQQSRLQECIITPLGSRELEQGVRLLPLHLEASGDLVDLTQFVRQIEVANLLCRVTNVMVEPGRGERRGNEPGSDSSLRMILDVEALLLEERDGIAASWPPKPVHEALPWSNGDVAILDRIRFSPDRDTTPAIATGRPSPTVRSPQAPKNSAATYLLMGSVNAGGRREAWFYDVATQKRIVVLEGDQLADSRLTVASIRPTYIELHQGTSTARLDIGKEWPGDEQVQPLESEEASENGSAGK